MDFTTWIFLSGVAATTLVILSLVATIYEVRRIKRVADDRGRDLPEGQDAPSPATIRSQT